MLKMLPAECEKTYRTHPKSNVCLTCHVISQSAFTTRESNFGGNNERREGMIAGYETTSERVVPIFSSGRNSMTKKLAGRKKLGR